jgi:hypothetical protein
VLEQVLLGHFADGLGNVLTGNNIQFRPPS